MPHNTSLHAKNATLPKEKTNTFRLLKNAMSTLPLSNIMPNNIPIRREFSLSLGRSNVLAQNQNLSGRCWIFASINVLRRELIQAFNLPSHFNLSHNYIYFYTMFERCNMCLEKLRYLFSNSYEWKDYEYREESGIDIADGGSYRTFYDVIEKYGIVPNDIFPDTFQSKHTHDLVLLLQLILRQSASAIYEKARNEKIFINIKKKALNKIYYLLCVFFGTPPSEFKYRWPTNQDTEAFKKVGGGPFKRLANITESITPKEFYNRYISKWMKDLTVISFDPRREKYSWLAPEMSCQVLPKDMYNFKDVVWELNFNMENMDEIKQTVINSLKKKHAVVFYCDITKYVNKKLNLLDKDASTVSQLFNIDVWNMPREDALNSRALVVNHAMTFIGYDKLTDMWEVENSWNDENVYTMSGEWFNRFVISIVVSKSMLNSNLRKKLKHAKIPLKPNVPHWDAAFTMEKLIVIS